MPKNPAEYRYHGIPEIFNFSWQYSFMYKIRRIPPTA